MNECIYRSGECSEHESKVQMSQVKCLRSKGRGGVGVLATANSDVNVMKGRNKRTQNVNAKWCQLSMSVPTATRRHDGRHGTRFWRGEKRASCIVPKAVVSRRAHPSKHVQSVSINTPLNEKSIRLSFNRLRTSPTFLSKISIKPQCRRKNPGPPMSP